MRTSGAMLPDERRRLIRQLLRENGSVSVSALEGRFAVSPMTARRDLDELDRQGLARRTHGGAVLPGLSSHEDSFQQRLESATDEKKRLAEAVLDLIEPEEAIFVDSSSTAFVAARRIVRENLPCTLLTNSVPVMELAAEIDAPQVELLGTGGKLRKLTRSFVGPQTIRGIEAHFADHVIFSVRDITPRGASDRSRRAGSGGQARDDPPRAEGDPAGRRFQVRPAGVDRDHDRGRRQRLARRGRVR